MYMSYIHAEVDASKTFSPQLTGLGAPILSDGHFVDRRTLWVTVGLICTLKQRKSSHLLRLPRSYRSLYPSRSHKLDSVKSEESNLKLRYAVNKRAKKK